MSIFRLIRVLAVLFLTVGCAHAATTSLQEVEAINPLATSAYKAAKEAIEISDDVAFDSLYKILELAIPESVPLLRLKAYHLCKTNFDSAIAIALPLYLQDPSFLNAYAMMYLEYAAWMKTNEQRRGEYALSYAKAVYRQAMNHPDTRKDPENTLIPLTIAFSQGAIKDVPEMVEYAEEHFPNKEMTNYFASMYYAEKGEYAKAEALLDRAVELNGKLIGDVSKYREYLQVNQRIFGIVPYWFLYATLGISAGWIFVIVGIRVVGGHYSKSVLSTINYNQADGLVVAPTERELALRKRYEKLITFASRFYFVTMPMTVFATICAFLGVVLIFLLLGFYNLGILIVFGLAAFSSIVATVKSLFSKSVEPPDPGVKVTVDEEPELWEIVTTVAVNAGTRPVDSIYLVEDTTIAVYEKGSKAALRNDHGERVLIIGVAALQGMKVGELKAIIAHEYGHFINRDTAGATRATEAIRYIDSILLDIYNSGNASKLNMGWRVTVYYRNMLTKISAGASRLQEILADRLAASLYGGAYFEGGLRHVILRTHQMEDLFEHQQHTKDTAYDAIAQFYHTTVDLTEDVAGKFEKALETPEEEWDTHPSPHVRFHLTSTATGTAALPGDDDLLLDRIPSLQSRQTVTVNTIVSRVFAANPSWGEFNVSAGTA